MIKNFYKFISIILISLMIFSSLGIINGKVYAADKDKYEYKIAVTTKDADVYGDATGSDPWRYLGKIKAGTRIRIYYEKGHEEGFSFTTMTESGGMGTPTFGYKLTSASKMINGDTAVANSYIEVYDVEIKGDDTEEIPGSVGADPTPDPDGGLAIAEEYLGWHWNSVPKRMYGELDDDTDTINYNYTPDVVRKLYDKLMDVEYVGLSTSEKEDYKNCVTRIQKNLREHAYFSKSEQDTMIKNLSNKINEDDGPTYTNPITVGGGTTNAENVTPDDIISDGDKFMEAGQNSNIGTINQNSADTVFDSIFNILLAIGITVAVIWGLIIAIKLMLSSVEEKAEYKKILWPYLVGCIVIFGAFGIWKLVILIMNNTL